MIGALVTAGKLDLGRMAAAVRAAEDPDGEPAGPGEDSELIAGGYALDVVTACLKQLETEKGSAAMAAAWQATGADILSFASSVRSPVLLVLLSTSQRVVSRPCKDTWEPVSDALVAYSCSLIARRGTRWPGCW